MSAAGNETVLKYDGTTNIVWTLKSPSAGDKVPASWRSETVGSAAAFRPEFRQWAYDAPSGKQRVVKTSCVYPVTGVDATGGRTKVFGYVTRVTETKIFSEAPDTDVQEAVAQSMGLERALRSDVIAGVGPT